MRVLISLHPHQLLLLSVGFISSVLVGMKWHLIVILISISLMVNGVEHLHGLIGHLCIFFRDMSISFAHFKNQVVFLLLNVRVFYVFWLLDPHHIHICKCCLPFCGGLFLVVSFGSTKVFNFSGIQNYLFKCNLKEQASLQCMETLGRERQCSGMLRRDSFPWQSDPGNLYSSYSILAACGVESYRFLTLWDGVRGSEMACIFLVFPY